MKIHGVTLENFMIFDKLETMFSPHINVICGENSTGKTSLVKALYASGRAYSDVLGGESGNGSIIGRMVPDYVDDSSHFTGFNDAEENVIQRKRVLFELTTKLMGVFSLYESEKILNNLKSTADTMRIAVDYGNGTTLDYVRNYHENTAGITRDRTIDFSRQQANIVYIPTREMISSTDGFISLYSRFNLDFEETYYDLALWLALPKVREIYSSIQPVLHTLEAMIGGKVTKSKNGFYLATDSMGELPMALVSEGHRKIAMLIRLIETGTLTDGSILFWDEPETNLNPKMTRMLVDALIALAGAGVQVFVTTHDYFIQQYFGLAAEYGEDYGKGAGELQYRFLSLYPERTEPGADGKTEEKIMLESADRLLDLHHNAIMEEFDAIYDREQRMIYGNGSE